VKFGNAFKKDLIPVPKIYGYDKTNNNSKAKFIIDSDEALKGCSGYVKFDNGEMQQGSISTVFSFHSSRINNRMAGRSNKEDGAIFYYEGIESNQVFSCEIIGNTNELNYIQQLFEQNKGVHRLGKSKSAQYSRVDFINFKIEELQDIETLQSPVYIVFQSPVITYNKYGVAVPDIEILKNELGKYFKDIKNIDIISSAEWVEQYMGVWKSKTPRENAFAIGTTIKLDFEKTETSIKDLEINGLGERKNEGFGRVKLLNLTENLERKKYIPPPNNKTTSYEVEYNNETLKDILNNQTENENLVQIQMQAIDKAGKYTGKLSNSLISRLKEELVRCNSISDWSNFMSSIKGKKAYEELDKENLWDDVSSLYFKNSNNEKETTFLNQKEFYLTFFKTLRKKSKKKQKDEK